MVWMLLFPSAYAQTQSSGIELLNKMARAAVELNYSGKFIYVKDGKISSMKISHVPAQSGGQQKLMALDGSMREIIQQDDVVACVLPDQGMGMREKRQLKQPFKLYISDKKEAIERNYDIKRTGKERVANRDCEKLSITPKDAMRYGYTLCVDSENYLLLHSELNAIDGRIMESYMFVEIDFDNVKPAELVSETAPMSLEWIDDQQSMAKDPMQKWQVIDNDSGFSMEHYIERISPILQAKVSHLVLGDGLAKVSVFVFPTEVSKNKQKQSLNMGILNSYTREVNGHMITAIGEVPQQTVSLIANSTELQ